MPPVRTSSRRPRAVAGPGGHFLDDHPDLDADRGRAQRRGIPSEQLSSLAEAGYLAVYDDGLVMLTPAALRAITIEVDRRAAARDAATGERGHHRPPLSS